jgi:hypothetical protein
MSSSDYFEVKVFTEKRELIKNVLNLIFENPIGSLRSDTDISAEVVRYNSRNVLVFSNKAGKYDITKHISPEVRINIMEAIINSFLDGNMSDGNTKYNDIYADDPNDFLDGTSNKGFIITTEELEDFGHSWDYIFSVIPEFTFYSK